MVRPSIRERFNMWVTPTTLKKCWEWEGSRTNWNYGRIRVGGQSTGAHRVAFILAGGSLEFPSILHKCDNPPCCNYSHLFQGTNGDNVRDMMAKGRGWQQQKTHCKLGHEFTPDNMLPKPNGSFQCLACHKISAAKSQYKSYWAKKDAEARAALKQATV